MVRILRGVHDGIIRHAESGFPHEVCGVLIGAGGKITHYRECRNLNTERARDRYDLDPVSFKEADEWARGSGLEIVGIYHSHPDHPPFASETDRQRAWPEWVYMIFSIYDGKYKDSRAWVLEDFDSTFIEAAVELVDG